MDKKKTFEEEKSAVDKIEERINRLNSFMVNNLGNKMKILKEEMKIKLRN